MKRVRNLDELSKLVGDAYVETERGEKVRIVREVVKEPAPAPAPAPADPALPQALAELIAKLVKASEDRTSVLLSEQARMIDRLAQPAVQKSIPAQPDTKQPHRWVFTIQRDEIGRLQQITATPAPP